MPPRDFLLKLVAREIQPPTTRSFRVRFLEPFRAVFFEPRAVVAVKGTALGAWHQR